MNKPIRWIIRCLALAHFTWGISLILLAAWFAASALLVLPHMSTGTIWTNLPTALTMASIPSFPLGSLGTWIIILGCRIWTGHAGLRKSLITTHLILLVPGAISAAVGLFSTACRSKERRRRRGTAEPHRDVPSGDRCGRGRFGSGINLIGVDYRPKATMTKSSPSMWKLTSMPGVSGLRFIFNFSSREMGCPSRSPMTAVTLKNAVVNLKPGVE